MHQINGTNILLTRGDTLMLKLSLGVLAKLYLKVSGVWQQCSKVYKKVNGSWVEQSVENWSSIFDTSTHYRRN